MDVYSYNMISYMLSNKILRFLSEIGIDMLPLVATNEITIFIFTVSKNGLFMNYGLSLAKRLKM